MATLQLKQVPEQLHRELKARAAGRHQSLRDYVLRILEREVSMPTVDAWLEEVRDNNSVAAGPSSAELVRAAREE